MGETTEVLLADAFFCKKFCWCFQAWLAFEPTFFLDVRVITTIIKRRFNG